MAAAKQNPAGAQPVRLVDADHLLLRLTSLAWLHEERGRVSHARGVRIAMALIRRELAAQRKVAADAGSNPPSATIPIHT